MQNEKKTSVETVSTTASLSGTGFPSCSGGIETLRGCLPVVGDAISAFGKDSWPRPLSLGMRLTQYA